MGIGVKVTAFYAARMATAKKATADTRDGIVTTKRLQPIRGMVSSPPAVATLILDATPLAIYCFHRPDLPPVGGTYLMDCLANGMSYGR